MARFAIWVGLCGHLGDHGCVLLRWSLGSGSQSIFLFRKPKWHTLLKTPRLSFASILQTPETVQAPFGNTVALWGYRGNTLCSLFSGCACSIRWQTLGAIDTRASRMRLPFVSQINTQHSGFRSATQQGIAKSNCRAALDHAELNESLAANEIGPDMLLNCVLRYGMVLSWCCAMSSCRGVAWCGVMW